MADKRIDVTLKRTEKNQVFEAVREFGFNVGDFEWSEDEHTAFSDGYPYPCRASILTHRATKYYIIFGGRDVEFSPGNRIKVNSYPHLDGWNVKLTFVNMWLQELKREVEAPDLWAMAVEDRNFFQLSSTLDANNTSFTSREQQYISERLDEMQDFVLASAQLTDEQRQLVQVQIEFVKEATKRLGRLDWKAVFIGTLLSLLPNLVVSAAFAPERARQLFHMAAVALTPLFKNLLGLGLP